MLIAELTTATNWEKSRLSHQLTRMAQRGLIRRIDSDSSRYPDVVLTDKGRTEVDKATPEHDAMIRTLFFDALGPERLAGFEEACTEVLRGLDAHQDGNCCL